VRIIRLPSTHGNRLLPQAREIKAYDPVYEFSRIIGARKKAFLLEEGPF
jgi:hypothetical protein